MDEFAKEYFKLLKPLRKSFESRRYELAESRIKMLVAAIYRQLFEYNEVFDLVIGAGNSGLYITEITELTYKQLNVSLPKILNIPIFRFKEDGKTPNDNLILLPLVKNVVQEIDKVDNVLFVDDEIKKALTAKECFNLVIKAKPRRNHLNATIIAENHFFEWHYKIPELSISFFAYSPLIQDFNENIGYFVPEDLYKEVLRFTNEHLSHNQVMAIILGGGIKRRDNKGNQYFDYISESDLENKISNYSDKKNHLVKRLHELVEKGIEEYKTGKIQFRF